MDLESLLKATNRLSDSKEIERLIIEAAKPYEAEMIDLNTSQLSDGKLSTNKKVTPKYSPEYAKFKGFKTPDLHLEGDFYAGFNIEFKEKSMIFDSNDDKTPKLETRYSSDIFGLTDKNKQEAVEEYIADDFIKLIANELTK